MCLKSIVKLCLIDFYLSVRGLLRRRKDLAVGLDPARRRIMMSAPMARIKSQRR